MIRVALDRVKSPYTASKRQNVDDHTRRTDEERRESAGHRVFARRTRVGVRRPAATRKARSRSARTRQQLCDSICVRATCPKDDSRL